MIDSEFIYLKAIALLSQLSNLPSPRLEPADRIGRWKSGAMRPN